VANAPLQVYIPNPRMKDVSDEDIARLLQLEEEKRRNVALLPEEDLNALVGDYTADTRVPATAEEASGLPPQLTKAPEPLTTGEAIAGGARELAGGAMAEFSDEAEAAARAPFSDASYADLLQGIRQSRARFAEANPGMALGLNVAGGVGSMFMPGAGPLAKGVEALSGIGKLASPLARTMATGALYGGVSGAGSGETAGDRFAKGAAGAALGAGFGAGAKAIGAGGKWLGDAYRARGQVPGSEEATNMAAGILGKRIEESGLTPADVRSRMALERQYGIPSTLGTVSPEVGRLTEAAVTQPSGERAALISDLLRQQAGASTRVQQKVQEALPAPDYFAEHSRVVDTLRNNAIAAYEKAYTAVDDIRDPRIMKILQDPDIRGAYADALENVRREQTAAVLRGEDPAKYELRKVFEPILDAEGSLVGLSKEGRDVPDLRTLDQIKQALDRKVNALYASGQGGSATALRSIRDAFVKRIDEVGPQEYRAARSQFKGDIEIREALEEGLKGNNLRWQEINQRVKDFSPGELQAFKTGYVQNLVRGFEDTSRGRNFAKEIIQTPNRFKSLQALMPANEFAVFSAALKREADLYGDISRITGGSPTAARVAERADIEQQIASGNTEAALDLILNPTPGNIARKALMALTKMRNANVSRAAYTELARLLRAGSTADVDAALQAIAAAAPARQAASRTAERRATATGAGLAKTVAPSPIVEKDTLGSPGELVIPDETLGNGLAPTPLGVQ